MIRGFLTIGLSVVIASGAASAQPGHRLGDRGHKDSAASVPGTTVETLTVGGETRTYRLHIPASLPAGAAPLVVSIHGLNSNAAQQESLSSFSALADQKGFIVAYPEGLNGQWRMFGKSDADVAFIAAVVADVQKRRAVDPGRTLVNGISNGAQMSWRVACDKPGLFAAAGFVSGGYPNACANAKHPPTIIFHGTADKVLPYDGRGGQMAVPDFAAAWAGCVKGAKGTPVDTMGEATSVTFNCTSAVTFYTIKDKGHSWPGSSMPARMTTQDVDASKEMIALIGVR